MTDFSKPPKSPTLLPPRKSVELEDPGAHELSENDDDHFSDAQEDRDSHPSPSSPIPLTRVEKVTTTKPNPSLVRWLTADLQVDDTESHGEVPGTDAYKIRTQDAVPDELEVIPERGHRRSSSKDQPSRPGTPGGTPVPRTVVEKIDPASPSHGEIPGTASHSKRKADAVPDIIRPVSPGGEVSDSGERGANISPDVPVPATVITKVDSKPSHGEVPGTDAYDIRKGDAKPDVVERTGDVADLSTRSRKSKQKRPRSITHMSSPIAADGGFGVMESDESEDEETAKPELVEQDEQEEPVGNDEGFGDDFDDFEAGATDEDFGEFDEGVVGDSQNEPENFEPANPAIQSLPPQESPFPLLDFSVLNDLDDIMMATSAHLDEICPTTKDEYPLASPPPSDQNSIFLTDRSLSLWSQLVAPPPLQPPNWVRSRIRRLFLVSLGVPVDLDEILPASKQKKLILPSTHLRSGSQSPPEGRRPGSRVRLKQDNESTTSLDKPSSSKANRKRKGPPAAPDLDLQATKMLCTTTDAALSNMTNEELEAHIKKLEDLTVRASQTLEYWLRRRDGALGEKEAFEGVIENLVKHARRVRK